MSRTNYGEHPSDLHHPTPKPKWLTRAPLPGAKYAIVDGLAFEITRGLFGYHVDRIDMGGHYLGETHWIEKWKDLQGLMAGWHQRPAGGGLGEYEAEDVFGNEDGTITAVARTKISRFGSRDRYVAKKRLMLSAAGVL